MAHSDAVLQDALEDSDLFGSLTEDEVHQLIGFGRTVSFNTGQIIFQKGDPGDFLAIVVTGRVRIGSTSQDGKEALLDFIEPGHCFGEIALLDGKPRSADATAERACQLFVLKRNDLLTFIEQHPEIALRTMGVLCRRLRRLTEVVEDAQLLHMEPRIARAVLRLASEYGKRTPTGIMIDLQLSQRDLGSYVGLARENVNRQLSQFRQRGLIHVERNQIVVLDEPGLRAIADEQD